MGRSIEILSIKLPAKLLISSNPDAATFPVQTLLRLALAQLGPAQHSAASAVRA